jgi:hypothetical protein
MRESTVSKRDQGLRRLRRTTSVVVATGGALAAAFAGLAAKALPGRHTVTTTTSVSRVRTAPPAKATAPALVPVQSAAPPPAAPAAPPVQAQSPPVVVSGGT